MANASPRDTRAGFDIFRVSGGEITQDDLNERLHEAGYGPVSPRTYRHYRNLLNAGFSRYISINRFDVARASAPYEDAASNARYAYKGADLGVNVVFAKSSKLMETYGRATEVGEVGALLRFGESEVIDGLQKLKPAPGDMVTVRYLELGRTATGTVVEADLRSDPAIVEIEYGRLVSIAAIGMGQPLSTSVALFVLRGPGENDTSLDAAGRRLHHFFEFVEGLRSVANEAGSRQAAPAYAPPPDLMRLSVASPAEIVLELADLLLQYVPWGVVAGALKLAYDLPAKRKEWIEGDGQREQNKILRIDAELKALELEKAQQEKALRDQMLTRLRDTLPDSTISDAEAARAINEFVIPPLSSLGRSGVTGLGGAEAAPTLTEESTDPVN